MTNKEAAEILRRMKSDFPLPKAAQTRRAQNDALDVAIEVLKAESCDDAISRQAAIDVFKDTTYTKNEIRRRITELPSAQPEQRWIPFKSKLPEDGQRILITVNFFGREKVQADEFYIAADGAYLYGMYEIGTEAVAWMPFPEPYKEGDK